MKTLTFLLTHILPGNGKDCILIGKYHCWLFKILIVIRHFLQIHFAANSKLCSWFLQSIGYSIGSIIILILIKLKHCDEICYGWHWVLDQRTLKLFWPHYLNRTLWVFSICFLFIDGTKWSIFVAPLLNPDNELFFKINYSGKE